jgi:hypothetical protein
MNLECGYDYRRRLLTPSLSALKNLLLAANLRLASCSMSRRTPQQGSTGSPRKPSRSDPTHAGCSQQNSRFNPNGGDGRHRDPDPPLGGQGRPSHGDRHEPLLPLLRPLEPPRQPGDVGPDGLRRRRPCRWPCRSSAAPETSRRCFRSQARSRPSGPGRTGVRLSRSPRWGFPLPGKAVSKKRQRPPR